MMEKRSVSMTPEMQQYHDTIFALSERITHLEGVKADLDVQINNRETFLKEYQVSQDKLSDVLKHIEAKTEILKDLSRDVEDMLSKKNELAATIRTLETEVSSKQGYLSDVDAIKKSIFILQSDHKLFIERHAKEKARIHNEILDAHAKIRTLHLGLSDLLPKS